MKNIIILFSLIPLTLLAAKVKFSAAALGSSNQIYQGALTWPDPGLAAGIAVKYKSFNLRGPHLVYAHPLKNRDLRLQAGLKFVNDSGPMIKLTSHDKDYRNQRDSSFGAFAKIEHLSGMRKKRKVGLSLFRDVIEHNGSYLKINGALPVLPFTSLITHIGLSTNNMARYAYGPTAKGGLTNSALGISFVWPKLPFDGIIMTSFTHHFIHQIENKNADYIRGDDQNSNFNLRVIANL